MKKKKVSLGDIAKACGVSKATVSFVLNGKGDQFNISKAKQKLIKEKAKELRYIPNFFAKSLKQGETMTIGLLVPDMSDPFYAQICKIIQEDLYKKGYGLFIINSNDNKKEETGLMRELIQRGIDGMIIIPGNDIDVLIPVLLETHIPVVFTDRPGDNEADFIGIDHDKEGYNIIRLFREKPNAITIFSEELTITPDQNFVNGIIKYCVDKKLDYKHIPINKKNEQIILEKINHSKDAFITVFPKTLFKLLDISENNKTNLFKQHQLICFGEHVAFSYMNPKISCLKRPVKLLAKQSVFRLIERIKKGKPHGSHFVQKCIPILRETH